MMASISVFQQLCIWTAYTYSLRFSGRRKITVVQHKQEDPKEQTVINIGERKMIHLKKKMNLINEDECDWESVCFLT